MPRRSPAPSRGTITRVSPHRRHQGDGSSEALRQGGGPAVSPSPTSRREHGMLDSNLSGKDSYIEWVTGLARAHIWARRHSLPLIDLLHRRSGGRGEPNSDACHACLQPFLRVVTSTPGS